MSASSGPGLLAPLGLALGLAACKQPSATSSTNSTNSKNSTIAEARQRDDGAEVTIEGHVSVAPDTFSSATAEHGFAVADGSAGIYVTMAVAPKLALGQRVQLSGVLGQMAKMRVVAAEPSAVTAMEGLMAVQPSPVATGAVDESVEGRLVRVSAPLTRGFVDDSPNGYKLWIDDGSGELQIFAHVSAGFDAASLRALTAGQTLTVTGLVFQYGDTYEVAPRSPADLLTP